MARQRRYRQLLAGYLLWQYAFQRKQRPLQYTGVASLACAACAPGWVSMAEAGALSENAAAASANPKHAPVDKRIEITLSIILPRQFSDWRVFQEKAMAKWA